GVIPVQAIGLSKSFGEASFPRRRESSHPLTSKPRLDHSTTCSDSRNSGGLMKAQLPALQRFTETPDRTMQRAIASRRLRQALLRVVTHETHIARQLRYMQIGELPTRG